MPKKSKRKSELPKNLAESVKEKRKDLGLTQSQLAEQAGVETETISRLERAVAIPSLLKLEEIAIALRVSMSDLIRSSSTVKEDQAEQLTKWLDGLTTKQRGFVLKTAKQQCEFFKSKI